VGYKDDILKLLESYKKENTAITAYEIYLSLSCTRPHANRIILDFYFQGIVEIDRVVKGLGFDKKYYILVNNYKEIIARNDKKLKDAYSKAAVGDIK